MRGRQLGSPQRPGWGRRDRHAARDDRLYREPGLQRVCDGVSSRIRMRPSRRPGGCKWARADLQPWHDSLPGPAGLYGPILNESDGRVRIDSGARLLFGDGLLRNDGSILVNTTGAATAADLPLDDSDGSEIGGTGAILLQGGGNPASALVSSWQGTYLTQQGPHTIHGNGWITAPFSNAGRVAADCRGGCCA